MTIGAAVTIRNGNVSGRSRNIRAVKANPYAHVLQRRAGVLELSRPLNVVNTRVRKNDARSGRTTSYAVDVIVRIKRDRICGCRARNRLGRGVLERTCICS